MNSDAKVKTGNGGVGLNIFTQGSVLREEGLVGGKR